MNEKKCLGLCQFEDDVCIGCGRSMEEITGHAEGYWQRSRMSPSKPEKMVAKQGGIPNRGGKRVRIPES